MKNKILLILTYLLISLSLCAQDLADLIERVTPAVVGISSEQVIKNDRSGIKVFPRDDAFDDFRKFFDQFDRFFMDKAPHPVPVLAQGSGFIIDQDGIIVTNYHVVQNAKEITVIMNDSTDFKAEVIGFDSRADLAVLKINAGKPLPFVNFGNSDKVRAGDSVIAVGNPFGLGGSISAGIVSAKSRSLHFPIHTSVNEFIQTDAAVNMGNSGGPLFNMNGEVIGVNTLIYSPNAVGNIGIGFAIPSNSAIPVINILKSGKKVKHGSLGVQAQTLNREMAESLNVKDVHGALIADVVKDSPADKAGIKPGDILIEFDGKKINKVEQLIQVVLKTEPNKKVKIKLLRNGKEINLRATIEELTSHDSESGDTEDKSKIEYITGFTVADPLKEHIIKKGVVVVDIDYNSPTAYSLKKGDVIMQVNGVEIVNTIDFNKQIDISLKKNSNAVLLLVYRSGQQFFVVVKLRSKSK